MMQAPAPFPLPAFLGKLCSRAELGARLATLPRPLVFTNGVFDVMHRGHAIYLAQARALGGSLVVGLNTDASARRLGKGPERPLNKEQDRAAMMAALEAVDLVTWFDEDTPLALIAEIRPDILVKGGDYRLDEIVGREVVLARGGRVMALPFVPGYSTTGLIERLRSGS